MSDNISLAVGDGTRRMTYAELAQARGISLASARRLARRHAWARQAGNDGVVRVTVPLPALSGPGQAQALSSGTRPMPVSDRPTPGPGPDPMTVIGISTLSQAVEMLREDLASANRSLLSERERAERAERRVDELLALLAEEQRRVGGLYVELADARTAAMITGCEAAALRGQLALLTERRPWWRRWFRG